MESFEARRTARTGALVAVGPAAAIAGAVGELVELVAPDGTTAYARLRAVGRAWTGPDGVERRYGYPDPMSIENSVGAASVTTAAPIAQRPHHQQEDP